MSASSGGGASTDTGHDEATLGARQTTVVVVMDETRLKAKMEDEELLAGKEEKMEQDGIDNPCYEADEPEEDCRTQKTKSNGTVTDSHSGSHETGNGSFLNNTSLTSHTNSAAVETSSDETKGGDEGEMAEAVNLELVNMRPFGNGINGIPVKKGEADEMGADLGDPYDEYFVPVNEHRKYIRGEKLYVTKDKRQQPSKRRCCCWVMALAAIAAILLAIIAACVILSQEDSAEPVESRNFGGSDSVVGAGVGGAGGTRITPQPPTRPPSERPTTDMSELYVAQALEGELTIDNMEYTPGLSIHNSSEFRNLATSLETELKMALFDRQTLNYGPFDIFVKVIDFLSGSVVVKYRVGWMPKEGVRMKGVPEPIGKDTLKQRLQEHLRRHEGFLYNYRLRLHNIKASQMVNLCQYDNGGCSDQCTFAYNTSMDFVCSCRAGRMLGEDSKTCSDQVTEAPLSSNPTKSEPQPEPESTAEPSSKPEPEPTVDGPESIPESSAEPTSEPKSEPEPYPEPESSPLPEPTSNPDSPVQPQPEPSPDPSAEPSPEPASEQPPKPPGEPSSELSAEPTAEPLPKPEEDATEKHRMVETPPMISVTNMPEDLAGPFPVDSEHNEETGTEHFKDLLTMHHETIIDNSNDTHERNQSAIVTIAPALKEQATGKESFGKYGDASEDVNKTKMALENEFTGRSNSREAYSPFGTIIQENNTAAPTELESDPEPEPIPEPTSEPQAEPIPASTSEVIKTEEVTLKSAEEKIVVPNLNGLLSVTSSNNESQIVEEKTVTPFVSNKTAEEMINELLSHDSQTPFIIPGENLTIKTPSENSTTQAPYLLNHAESVGSNTLVPDANSTLMKTYNDTFVPVKHKKKGSRLDDNQLWVGNTGSPEHESDFVVIHETTTEVGLTEQPVIEKESNSKKNTNGSGDSYLVTVKTPATEEVIREPDLSAPASTSIEEASSEEMKLMGTSDHAIVTDDTLISSTVASPLMETVVPNNGDNNFKHDVVSNIVTELIDLNNLKTESNPSIEIMSPTMSSVPSHDVTSSIMIPAVTELTSISLTNNVSQAGESSTIPVTVESIDHDVTHDNEMETVETGNNVNHTLERNDTTMVSVSSQHTTEINSVSPVQSTNVPEYPKGEVQNELKPNVSDLGLAYDHERPSDAVFSNEAVGTDHPLFRDNKKVADSVQLGKEARKEGRKETENHYFTNEEEASGTSKPLFDIDKTKNTIVQTTVGFEHLSNKGSNESTTNSPDLIIALNPGTLSTETKENVGTIPVTQNVPTVDFTSEISDTNIEKPENISVDKYGYKKKDKKANKYDSTEGDLSKNYYEKKGKLEKEKKLDRVAANDNDNNKSPVVELATDHDELEEVDVGHSKTLIDYGNAVDVETDKKGKKKGPVLKNVEGASEGLKVVLQSMGHQNLTEHPQTNISNTSGASVTEVVFLEHQAETSSLIPTTSVPYVMENATSEGSGGSSSSEPFTSSSHVMAESSSLAPVMSVLNIMETASSKGNTLSDSATLEDNGGSTSLAPTVSASNVTDGATSEVSTELSSSSPLTPASDITLAPIMEPNFVSSSLAPVKAATYEVVEITTTEDTLQNTSMRTPPGAALPFVAITAAHIDEGNDDSTTLLPEAVTVTSDSSDSRNNATQGNAAPLNDTSMVVDVLPAGFSKCAAGQFQCTNGTTRDGAYCVSRSSKCDSVNDCSDSSDELHCVEEGCPGNFKCLDGQCLKRHLVCNGVTDCKDGSDESACGNWTCQFDELQCPSGRCIPTLWQCDGKADCGNHTDEFNCHDSCGNDEYLCPEGWCVPLTWRCNGVRDCANGQDEKLCDCSLEQFKCETGGCVDRTEVCDGVDNCPDNSDEWGCVSLDNMNLTVRSWDNAWAGVCSSSGWRSEWSDLVCRGQGFARAHFTRQEPLPSPAAMPPRLLTLSPGASLDSPLRLPALLAPAPDNCTATVEIACQEFVCGGSGLPDTATAKLLTGSVGNYTWPSVAILYQPDIKSYCTASVVSPKWLLASFNCLRSSDKSLSPLGWTAYAGGSMFNAGSSNTKQVRSLRSIVAHPQAHFNQLLYTNNMVLVELLAPFTLSSADADVDAVVAASCLPEGGVDQGQICLSAGWGYTQPGERNFRQYVNYMPKPSIELSECNSTEHYPGFIRQTDICTDAAPQTEPCYNDEGAALLCINEGGVWELHGLLSYRRCGHRAAHPAVYSSVSAARPWIEQTIGSKFQRKSTFNVKR